jgi:hypothetical protein
MLRIAHIVNPVKVNESSDLYTAQPITFETLRIAGEFAESKVDVSQFAAAFPEDFPIIPDHLGKTRPLERSILDFPGFFSGRKLPLIKDILDRLYEETRADYLIYTNVDISPLPHFYVFLKLIINQGYDAFIVNRRTIAKNYSGISEIPSMFADIGDTHPGCDCFVFKRELYPKFVLGNVVIGCEFFGLTLRTNVMVFSRQFNHFKDLHLTFHIGDDRTWKTFTGDALHNQKELEAVFSNLLENKSIRNREMLMEFHRLFSGRGKQLRKRIETKQDNKKEFSPIHP